MLSELREEIARIAAIDQHIAQVVEHLAANRIRLAQARRDRSDTILTASIIDHFEGMLTAWNDKRNLAIERLRRLYEQAATDRARAPTELSAPPDDAALVDEHPEQHQG